MYRRQFRMAARGAGIGDFGKFSESECRMVAVGRSGSGKSTMVNSLIGAELCVVGHYGESMTTEAKMFSRPRFGKEIRVVDTPGLFDSRPEMTNQMVVQKLASTALLLAPGPHVILLTIVLGQRFTAEEKAVVKHLRNFFGEEAIHHTIVVFTKGDEMEKKGVKIEDYVKNAPADLKLLLNEVGQHYVVISNETASARDESAKAVLNVVEKIVSHATSPFYSSKLFRQAETEMSQLDQLVDQKFRPPRSGASHNLTNSMHREKIVSILRAESDIINQTSVPQEAEMKVKDENELAMLATRLIRLVIQNEVSEGKQREVVQNLVRSSAMKGLRPLLPEENPDEGDELSNKFKN